MSAHTSNAETAARPTLAGHFKILRVDHWVKNVFVLPGVIAALSVRGFEPPEGLAWRFVVGMLSVCLVASSNYVINEVLDAPFDRRHPTKKSRPTAAGLVHIPLAYVQWLVVMALGMALAALVSKPFAATMAWLWIMGCVYNISPLRSKDKPFVDVLTEAINNPIRLLAGWYIVGVAAVPPASLLISYWMVGCYFMAIKRYAELREISQNISAGDYRPSFRYYTLENLLVSIMFYGSTAMLFFGAFTIRYRLEWILSFPLVAYVMAAYLHMAFKPDSAAQAPEKLYREPLLMATVVACALVMAIFMFVDLPWMHGLFEPTIAPAQ